ncbi:carbonic anhydrase [Streptomyces sp. NPDC101237]|uniref:carbonic anhydrase n=1 Tax=Streptomyces sp. NPDC101237 TaxID=3366139 RepID=UPI00380C79D4
MASNRRAFLTVTASATASAAGALAVVPAQATAGTGRPPAPAPATASAALDELLAGNRRYAVGRPRRPQDVVGRRRVLAGGQHPFAAVLGCIDSRVVPELVFDQGLGDLLCIRTAGQVLDEAVLGSLQYAVEELRVPLVVVLGHERCGAVAATLGRLRTGAAVPGHLELLVEEISPAARRTRALPGDWAEHTMRAHTAWVRDAIRADPAFAGASVVAARFDLDSGLVALLP